MNRKCLNVRSNTRRARGFTLVEILVALAVMVILGSVLYPSLMSEIHFSDRATTRARLAVLRRAVNEDYMRHAMAIDTLAPGANTIALDTASSYTLTTGAAFLPGDPQAIQDGFLALAQYADTPARALATDGFGRPWVVFVSDPLTTVKDGVTLTYHTIAFVSNDGGPENTSGQVLSADTTFDPTTGILTLGGHNVGVVINGAVVERRLLRRTLNTMRLVASEYATYFTTQYESNINRDITIDYFASAPPGSSDPSLWNNSSAISNSANGNGPGFAFPGPLPAGAVTTGTLTGPSICDMQPVTDIGFATTLGLSATDQTSAWGYDLGVGNGPNSGSTSCDGDDRDPESANSALTSPPYTALIGAWVPGGALVTVPVIGSY